MVGKQYFCVTMPPAKCAIESMRIATNISHTSPHCLSLVED